MPINSAATRLCFLTMGSLGTFKSPDAILWGPALKGCLQAVGGFTLPALSSRTGLSCLLVPSCFITGLEKLRVFSICLY